MSLELTREVWDELKRFVGTVDRQEAAESIVHLLIDNDYDADDIKESFKGDSDIKSALIAYLDELEDDDYDDDDYEDDEDDEY